MRAYALVGVALFLGLSAAGCGSQEGTGTTISEVNASCHTSNTKASSEIVKAGLEHKNRKSGGLQFEASTFVPILVSDAESEVHSIESLSVPSGDERKVQAIIEAYEAWIQGAKGNPKKVVVSNDIYEDARNLAGRYGLANCALSPFEPSSLEEASS